MERFSVRLNARWISPLIERFLGIEGTLCKKKMIHVREVLKNTRKLVCSGGMGACMCTVDCRCLNEKRFSVDNIICDQD